MAHDVSRTGSDCYINDCLVFDVFSVKRMYNVKVSTGKNTWCSVKVAEMDDDDDDDDDVVMLFKFLES